ncbi:MAG: hypothetical protein E6J44_01790 [Chloroflexi bacterium]|nr:MAG: hypothetical protein E6J44_01790 [Chloroflexota bacterium]TMC16560.1 MAG: hypothetical protein E6J33_09425 [Chloroflexota bacterium]
MGQDPNQQSQYGRGYGGYTQPPRPSDTFDSQQYGQQQGSYQQSSYGQQQQQQSGTYQPPGSAARGTGAHDPTSTGLNGRTEALLSYVLGWFSGLIFFVIERKNRFVRFHAAQSFIFFGIVSVVYIVIRLLSIIPVLGFLLSPVLGCATLILLIPAALIWVLLMIQAYRGVNFRLPIISGYADSLIDRFTSKKKRRTV